MYVCIAHLFCQRLYKTNIGLGWVGGGGGGWGGGGGGGFLGFQ